MNGREITVPFLVLVLILIGACTRVDATEAKNTVAAVNATVAIANGL